ncbi:MAG: NF038143 family protein [Desulfobacterales bacterium]|nr:NF038143 family protein [Desulfobacterales bacterium]
MSTVDQKHQIILAHEKNFADYLALRVLEKPKLSVWMILIPIIFVHYFHRIQKFNSGRSAFAENYMILRERAMDEALDVIQTGRTPDIDGLAMLSTLTEAVHRPNLKMLELLVSHYTDLMRSEGDTMESLVRSFYKTRTNYLLFVNQLNQTERALNAVLKPHLTESVERIDEIISAMETNSEKIRRYHAETVFP